jgi:tripartite ATP-independent transporter DctM subunit
MTEQSIGLLGLAALVVLIAIRVPVATALILVGGLGYTAIDGWWLAWITLGDLPFNLAQAYSLSVVPLFLLMGVVAARTNMARDLYSAFEVMFARVRGGVAMATIAACAGFGAICGSSLATASTMTKVCLPEMRRHGYSDAIAAGLVASGGTLGILIPPSIILVIYAIASQQSVPELFAAALVPGILLTLLHMVAIQVIARYDLAAVPPVAQTDTRSRGDSLRALRGLWKLALLFVVVVGGIYGGWFTPTEAAAFGAGLTILLGFACRTLTGKGLLASLGETIRTTGLLFFIVLGAYVFAAFMVETRLPITLGNWIEAAGWPPLLVIFFFLAVYLVLGCFLDSISMILITVPVFLPIAEQAGFSAIWFGIFIVIVAEIGLITPPVGLNLFVMRAQARDLPLTDIYRGIIPFVGVQLIAVFLLIAVPTLATWLPDLLY